MTRAGIAQRRQPDGHLISGRRVGNFVIRSLCPTLALAGPVQRVVGRLLRRRKPSNSKLLPPSLGVPQVVLSLLVEPAL